MRFVTNIAGLKRGRGQSHPALSLPRARLLTLLLTGP